MKKVIFFYCLLSPICCCAHQDTSASKTHALSSFYFGGHVSPQMSIYLDFGNGYTPTAFAGSVGIDFMKKISSKAYLMSALVYSYQSGQVIPYWLKFTDVGSSKEINYEKWSLLKIPLQLCIIIRKASFKNELYPFCGLTQAFHLKEYNNDYYATSSNAQYPLINLYLNCGVGMIHHRTNIVSISTRLQFEHNFTNIAPISGTNGQPLNKDNNFIVGFTFGILFHKI